MRNNRNKRSYSQLGETFLSPGYGYIGSLCQCVLVNGASCFGRRLRPGTPGYFRLGPLDSNVSLGCGHSQLSSLKATISTHHAFDFLSKEISAEMATSSHHAATVYFRSK